MENRLSKLHENEADLEAQVEEVKSRIVSCQQQKISEDNIYQFLLYFDQLYNQFNDGEKKEFLSSFIEAVYIFEDTQLDGRILKRIKFRFQVYFNGKYYDDIGWDSENAVETAVCLNTSSKKQRRCRQFCTFFVRNTINELFQLFVAEFINIDRKIIR